MTRSTLNLHLIQMIPPHPFPFPVRHMVSVVVLMRSVGISLVTALLANTCVAQEAIVAELYERGSFQPSSAGLGTYFTDWASLYHKHTSFEIVHAVDHEILPYQSRHTIPLNIITKFLRRRRNRMIFQR